MIQVIKTLEELEALKNNWENLFTQASTATPYQTWHFYVQIQPGSWKSHTRQQLRLLLKMAIISRMLLVEESWNFFLAWILILCFRMN